VKFNFKQLKDAVAHMGYDITDAGADALVDIEMITEDPGQGNMVDCIRVAISYVKPATAYSKETQVTKTLEIYTDQAKTRPRYAETLHREI